MNCLRISLVAVAFIQSLHAVTPVPKEIVLEHMPGAKPRNVVFILSDDHRYDAMSFLGHQFAKTPVMDSLAANGAYIKNALVTTSLCSPSRASILTGLYTFRHRVIDNNRPIPPGTIYFPQFCKRPVMRRHSSASGTWEAKVMRRSRGSIIGSVFLALVFDDQDTPIVE